MGYRLKPQYEAFTVVDGEFAGRTFNHSAEYETIPPQDKEKFEKMRGSAISPKARRGGEKETQKEDVDVDT
jgi:hypothetical protein